jgi:hypothetical protein
VLFSFSVGSFAFSSLFSLYSVFFSLIFTLISEVSFHLFLKIFLSCFNTLISFCNHSIFTINKFSLGIISIFGFSFPVNVLATALSDNLNQITNGTINSNSSTINSQNSFRDEAEGF